MNARAEELRYRRQLEESWEFQDFVAVECWKHGIPIHCFQGKKHQRIGEGLTGIEIKFDGKMTETGNLYIEYAEKTRSSNAEYVPSGVMRDDNTWLLIIGNKDIFIFLSKRQLKRIVEETIAGTNGSGFRLVETPTSKGVLLPAGSDEFRKLVIHVIRPEAGKPKQ